MARVPPGKRSTPGRRARTRSTTSGRNVSLASSQRPRLPRTQTLLWPKDRGVTGPSVCDQSGVTTPAGRRPAAGAAGAPKVVCGPAGAGAGRWLAASSSAFWLAMLPFPQEWSGRGGDRANARGEAPDGGLVHAAILLRGVLCSLSANAPGVEVLAVGPEEIGTPVRACPLPHPAAASTTIASRRNLSGHPPVRHRTGHGAALPSPTAECAPSHGTVTRRSL